MLVLAGPGSEKTHVLTYRIVGLIDRAPEQHFKVLVLIITNKAVADMLIVFQCSYRTLFI